MTPRTRLRLARLGLLLGVAALVWLAVRSAPERNDAPMLAEVLGRLEQEQLPEALAASALASRWDLPGLIANLRARRRILGAFQRVVDSGPAEPVEGAREPTERRRFRVAFERGEVNLDATLVRRNGRWWLLDFDLPLRTPPPGPALEANARDAAQAIADALARRGWAEVHEKLARARRVGEPLSRFEEQMQQALGQPGGLLGVDTARWAMEGGRGVLDAVLRYDAGERRAHLELTYAADEGRWLLTALELAP